MLGSGLEVANHEQDGPDDEGAQRQHLDAPHRRLGLGLGLGLGLVLGLGLGSGSGLGLGLGLASGLG